MAKSPCELTITKLVFDDWWQSTYTDCIEDLLPQEIEALVDFHWRELQATAIRLREIKEDPTEGCTCGASVGSPPWFHMGDCPLYRAPR